MTPAAAATVVEPLAPERLPETAAPVEAPRKTNDENGVLLIKRLGRTTQPAERVADIAPASFVNEQTVLAPDPSVQRAEMERQQREAELQRQREAELQRQREAELQRQREAELRAEQEAELQLQRETELQRQREAALHAEQEAELRRQREADLRAEQEAQAERDRVRLEQEREREEAERAEAEARDAAKRAEAASREEAKRSEAEARAALKRQKAEAKEAAKRAQAEAKETAKRAEIEAREAAKRAEIEAREAAKRAEAEAKEAAKRAEVEAKEAAKRAKKEKRRPAAATERRAKQTWRERSFNRDVEVLGLVEREIVTSSLKGRSYGRATLLITNFRVALISGRRTNVRWIPLEEVNQIDTMWRGAPTVVVGGTVEVLRFRMRSAHKLSDVVHELMELVQASKVPGSAHHSAELTQAWCDKAGEVWDSQSGRIRLFVRRHPAFTLGWLSALVPLTYLAQR